MVTYLKLELNSPQPLPCLSETWYCPFKGLTSTEEPNNATFPPQPACTSAARAQRDNSQLVHLGNMNMLIN